MRRTIPFAFVSLALTLSFCAHAAAQDSKAYVRHGTGAPVVCPLGTVYVDDSTGNAYANKLGACQQVGGGVTNSAGSNVVPKSNGTNLIASAE